MLIVVYASGQIYLMDSSLLYDPFPETKPEPIKNFESLPKGQDNNE